jgi:hypothetical protein
LLLAFDGFKLAVSHAFNGNRFRPTAILANLFKLSISLWFQAHVFNFGFSRHAYLNQMYSFVLIVQLGSVMSTENINNTQKYSTDSMAVRWNPLHNMGMGTNRSQVKINFDAEFKGKFDREVERRRRKPAALATAVLEWWLKQPPFVQNLALEGFEAIPEPAHRAVAEAIAKHLVAEAAMTSTPPTEDHPDRQVSEGQADQVSEDQARQTARNAVGRGLRAVQERLAKSPQQPQQRKGRHPQPPAPST